MRLAIVILMIITSAFIGGTLDLEYNHEDRATYWLIGIVTGQAIMFLMLI